MTNRQEDICNSRVAFATEITEITNQELQDIKFISHTLFTSLLSNFYSCILHCIFWLVIYSCTIIVKCKKDFLYTLKLIHNKTFFCYFYLPLLSVPPFHPSKFVQYSIWKPIYNEKLLYNKTHLAYYSIWLLIFDEKLLYNKSYVVFQQTHKQFNTFFDNLLDFSNCRFPQHTIYVKVLIVILSSIILSFEKGICRPFLYKCL